MAHSNELVWLIQKNQDDQRAVRELQDILDDMRVRWIEIEFDFSSKEMPPIIDVREGDRLICHGPSFIPRIDHADPVWRIGCVFDPRKFRWSEFQKNWNGMMLSTDGHVSSVRTVQAAPPTAPIFIRPDADSKTFEGDVKSPVELLELLSHLESDLPVVTATPIEIDVEYRIFMIASEVVAASQYRENGKLST